MLLLTFGEVGQEVWGFVLPEGCFWEEDFTFLWRGETFLEDFVASGNDDMEDFEQ